MTTETAPPPQRGLRTKSAPGAEEARNGSAAPLMDDHSTDVPGPTVKVFKALWKARHWIGAASLIGGAATAWYFAQHPVEYESTAVVMFNGQWPSSENAPLMPGEPAPGPSRLRLLATSTAVTDVLIGHYGLYRHYFIDTVAPLFHEVATTRLRQNIEVSITDDGSMHITVRDMDRAKAAQLADAIFIELHAIVQHQTDAYFNRQVKLHQDLLAHQQAQAALRLSEFEALGTRLGPLMSSSGTEDRLRTLEFEQKLAQASSQLAEAYSEIQSLGNNMELLASMNRAGQLGELTLVNRAMQDVSTQPRITIVWGIIGGMVLTILICSLIIALWASEGPAFMATLREVRQSTDPSVGR